MPGEDQERFEDYLDLERFIAELQAGHVAHPPQELTPAQARIYLMATQFHAATPGVGEPDPEFAEQLHTRLEEELEAMQDTLKLRQVRAQAGKVTSKKRISRRMLLAGSATAAASVTAGAVTEHIVEQALRPASASPSPHARSTEVTVTKWFPVTTVAELGNQAVKFTTENLIGYVLRYDGASNVISTPNTSSTHHAGSPDATDATESIKNTTPPRKGDIIAFSAACTHRGCIVQWDGTDRKFHCPCHGGVFGEDGWTDQHMSALRYLVPLAPLDVYVENGQIYVKMPTN